MPLHIGAYLNSAVNWMSVLHNIDSDLVVAVVYQESGGQATAVGDDGHSVGLMQLHDEGAGSGMSVEARIDPLTNLHVGCGYLADCIARAPSEEIALVWYNAGQGGWERMGRPSETGYSRAVLAIRDRIRSEGYRVVGLGRAGLKWR